MPEAKRFKLEICFWTRDRRGNYAGGESFFDQQTYWFDTLADANAFLSRRDWIDEYKLFDPDGNLIQSKG